MKSGYRMLANTWDSHDPAPPHAPLVAVIGKMARNFEDFLDPEKVNDLEYMSGYLTPEEAIAFAAKLVRAANAAIVKHEERKKLDEQRSA